MKEAIEKLLKQVVEKKITSEQANQFIEQLKKEAGQEKQYSEYFSYNDSFLRDHTVFDRRVLLGVTHFSLAFDGLRKLFGDQRINHIHRLLFINPVILEKDEQAEVTVIAKQEGDKIHFVNKFAKNAGPSYDSASGAAFSEELEEYPQLNLKPLKSAGQAIDGQNIYGSLGVIHHGPSLRCIRKVYRKGEEALGELVIQPETLTYKDFSIHPSILDGAVVSSIASLSGKLDAPYIPIMIKDIFIYHLPPVKCYCHSRITNSNQEILEADIDIVTPEGKICLVIKGFACKRISQESMLPGNAQQAEKSLAENKTDLDQKPLEAVSGAQRENLVKRVEKYIVQKIKSKVGKDQNVGVTRNFMDIGVESNELVMMAQEIENDLKIELYPTLFFEYQNIKGLAAFLASQFSKQLTPLFAAEAGTKEVPEVQPTQDQQAVIRGNEPGKLNLPVVSLSNQTIDVNTADHDIAVIGMAGVFPGATDVDAFWQLLRNKTDLMKEIPADHFDYRPFFDTQPAVDKLYCKWGSFIDEVDKFDAAFFMLSPREAEFMDPQLRYLLQVLYETSENAGYAKKIKGSNTGMFVGVCFHDYHQELERHGIQSPYIGTGNVTTMIANRPSFFFDLKGPSLAIDTACSSSLIAIHLACRSLQNKECDMAFVAGTNLLLSPGHYVYFCSLGALSHTGRCHTFDNGADGYVPGESVAAILLKPLSKAIADGDTIHAVIKGTATNHGGYTSSITAPSPVQEAQVLLDAWRDAAINPETLGYIEAHGTGTKLGDPIEINGLKNAFKKYTRKENFCAIGSAKAHIGHAEGAAGIVGVIKAILSIKNKEIPAMPFFNQLNSYIQLDHSPVFINREVLAWEKQSSVPRRAGVSSFGFGGAYAHVVIEEYESEPPIRKKSEPSPNILIFSAKKENSLLELAKKLLAFLYKNRRVDLEELAYTLQNGREEYEYRGALIAATIEEAIEKLGLFIDNQLSGPGIYKGYPQSEDAMEETTVEIKDDILIRQDLLPTIAAAWINGRTIDWQLLYPDYHPRMIQLPTYVFEKKSYWFDRSQGPVLALADLKTKNVVQELRSARDDGTFFGLRGPQDLYQGDEVTMKIIHDSIALVTMQDREAKNMFSDNLGKGLISCFYQINWNDQIKVVIVTGYDNLFNMGGTGDLLQSMSDKQKSHTDTNISFVYEGLLRCRVPVISAMQGHAYGGGFVFGLFGDIIVMAEEGIYSSNFMRYGFTPGVGTTYILKEKLGLALANEMMFTANSYTGSELKRRGASFIFTGRSNVLNEAIKIAQALAEKPLHSLEVLKEELAGRLLLEMSPFIASEEKMHYNTVNHPAVKERLGKYFGEKVFLSSPTLTNQVGNKPIPTQVKQPVLAKSYSSGGKVRLSSTEQFQSATREETGTAGKIKLLSKTVSYASETVTKTPDQGKIMDQIITIVGNILHLDRKELNPEMSFKDLGVESISGVEIIRDINRTFGLNLDAVVLYDHATINKLTAFIAAQNIKNAAIPLAESVQPNIQADIGSGIPETGTTGTLNRIQDQILAIISPILHLDKSEISLNATFKDLGVESISGVEIIRDINCTFGLNLDAVIMYDYSTVKALAAYIQTQTGDDVLGQTKIVPENSFSAIEFNDADLSQELIRQPDAVDDSELVITEKKSDTSNDYARWIQERLGGDVLQEKRLTPIRQTGNRDIAVIGMSCRFAGAVDLEEFWKRLVLGVDNIIEVPRDRWDPGKYYDPDPRVPNKTYCKWGGFIKDADKFDPLFFNISPLEAERMDPQQRIFLEEAWRSIESTGYPPEYFSSLRCGIFAGVSNGDYLQLSDVENLDGQILMGSSNSILAARISYFLNLTGPNIAMDTACSSSLVSVHLACQSIINGESDLALAGGVCVLTRPEIFIMTSKAGMLSQEGKCKAFDDNADGFVPGEGAGLVVLKPLDKALADHDTIYGVIKGSAVNQDGKTNGITAPSSNSQYELEKRVYLDFSINPQEISYVEAHGTGTKLGDPIEINALTRSFREFTDLNRFCAIGSVKTNIGHALTASGIASLIKVLLCLRHKKLVPSLHYQVTNSHINFNNSPFYVNTEFKDWEVADGEKRRAAVSSFGFSGTNCHMVVEEAPREVLTRREGLDDPAYLIMLSAKTKKALAGRVEQLTNWLQENHPDLGDLAHTLAAGRSHFNCRIAYVVTNMDELTMELQNFLRRKDGGAGERNASLDQTALALIRELATTDYIGHDEHKAKLLKLADCYNRGAAADWQQLYRKKRYQRLMLPGYPFAKERYWLREERNISSTRIKSLHPLIDSNESTLDRELFYKRMSRNDFYLKDHVVSGGVILPGAAYIEMACAAGKLAGELPVQSIEDVVFIKPAVLDQENLDMYIALYPAGDTVDFEIFSRKNGAEEIHSRGRIRMKDSGVVNSTFHDIESIKSRCPRIILRDDYYRIYRENGFDYGKTFQVTEMLFGGGKEALAFLTLPDELATTFPRFTFHPSLLDGALRVIMGVQQDRQNFSSSLHLPFKVGRIELLKPMEKRVYAYCRLNNDQYHIAILNEGGEELIRIHDFATREVKGALNSERETEAKLLFFKPVWQARKWKEQKGRPIKDALVVFTGDKANINLLAELTQGPAPSYQRVIQVEPDSTFTAKSRTHFGLNPAKLEDYHRLFRALAEQSVRSLDLIHLWNYQSPEIDYTGNPAVILKRVEEDLRNGLYSILHLFKAANAAMPKEYITCWYCPPSGNDDDFPQYNSISGFANSLTTLNHRFSLISIQTTKDALKNSGIEKIIKEELSSYTGNEVNFTVKYDRTNRYISSIKPYEVFGENQPNQLPLKQKGVYLITGGLGGLGIIFARHLAGICQARLILTGRSALNEESRKKIETLKSLGADVLYIQSDVGSLDEVRKVYKTIIQKFGRLDGIIHSAGIGKAPRLTEAGEDEFWKLITPKLNGALNLDLVTRDIKLDFLVMFSSIAAFTGDFGMGSYAAANAYLNSFAGLRNRLVEQGKRHGRTVAINWCYWREGGMELPENEKVMYYQYSGLQDLSTEDGLQAFERILKTGETGLIVAYGENKRISRILKVEPPMITVSATSFGKPEAHEGANLGVSMDQLSQKTKQYLSSVFSKAVKLPMERIAEHTPFEEYGINSVMIMEVNSLLEKDFSSLPKTLLFEYNNLHELTGYFVQNYPRQLQQLFKILPGAPDRAAVSEEPTLLQARRMKNRFSVVPPIDSRPSWLQDFDIAIIGISGEYAKADNLIEFWKNLCNGMDCVEEIPETRWDYKQYFNPKAGTPGKTYCKWGSFIRKIDKFDPMFFNISPREANTMDPQERLFLQTVWQTMENGGYSRQRLIHSANSIYNKEIGVFVGVMWDDYRILGGNSNYSSIANRVSYVLNSHGPSIAVDTACSSSLTAIHLACESIKRGECVYALAGGVNALLHPNKYIILSQISMLSSEGKCKSFGEGGDGYVPGEGVGAVLLKPLHLAQKDHDHIYAVIKGSSLNHGGKTSGFTVPNPNAQSALIEKALTESKIDPRTISYIEAHGTGTALGDPIEIIGLTKTYRQYNQDNQYCAIGSVKSNLGHLEGAAGVAAVTKVVLQLQNKQLVPSIHSQVLNKNIDFENTPFYVQRELAPWRRPVINGKEYPRTAGISSFGAGGTNVHLILQEYPEHEPTPTNLTEIDRPNVILLSARNKERLKTYAQMLLEYLTDIPSKADHSHLNPELLAEITGLLLELTAQILGIEKEYIPVDEEFGEMGLDQVQLTHLADHLKEYYLINTDINLFRYVKTIQELSYYLLENEDGQWDLFCGYDNYTEKDETPVHDERNDLQRLAYTLQVGREPLAERLAIIVDSVSELRSKLADYLAGKGEPLNNIYTGNIRDNDAKTSFIDGNEGEEYIRKLVEHQKLDKLALMWTRGIPVDWELYYPEKLSIINTLPVYPFEEGQYWIQDKATIDGKTMKNLSLADLGLHPLIGRNTSTIFEQKYSSFFTGNEFFIKDHQINQITLMPGAALIEMVRSACEMASEGKIAVLKEVSWTRPVIVSDAGLEVHTILTPESNGIAFDVATVSNDREVINFSGKARIGKGKENFERIDIEAIRNRCTQKVTGKECYGYFKTMGMEYGPSFQAIQELSYCGQEVLCRLALPIIAMDNADDFVIHPSMLDGAFTAMAGLLLNKPSGDKTPYIPSQLDELTIYQRTPRECFAYVSDSTADSRDELSLKVNLKLCDEKGTVLIDIKGLTAKRLVKTSEQEAEQPVTTLFFHKEYRTRELPHDRKLAVNGDLLLFAADDSVFQGLHKSAASGNKTVLILPGECFQKNTDFSYSINPLDENDYQRMFADLQTKGVVFRNIVYHWNNIDPMPLFHLSRAMLQSNNHRSTVQFFYLYNCQADPQQIPYYQAVTGFARSLCLENKWLDWKSIALSAKHSVDALGIILAEIADPTAGVSEIWYREDTRQISKYLEYIPFVNRTGIDSVLKKHGTYLITGGAGGIGLIFARYLAEQYQANCILTGRSPLSDPLKAKLEALKELVSTISYIQNDIGNQAEVEGLCRKIKETFGAVNGILHCAGTTRDAYLIKKSALEMEQVLNPKVRGTIYLDEAFAGEPLDFFFLFSSTAVLGNAGQCDYSYANAFLDSYAGYREELFKQGLRHGKTLSINWPYWEEGGMQIDEPTKTMLMHVWGMRPLSTVKGIEVFEAALKADCNQFMVIEGVKEKILKNLSLMEVKPADAPVIIKENDGGIVQLLAADIGKIICSVLSISSKDIGLDMDIKEYGFDSITLTEFSNQLNHNFNLEITPTLFFELASPTIRGLSQHLFNENSSIFYNHYYQLEAEQEEIDLTSATIPAEPLLKHQPRNRFTGETGRITVDNEEAIAVIGMSGIMPSSADLDQYWRNLEQVKDLITKFPSERWNLGAFNLDSDVQWGGFINEVDKFDAPFFGISPREAVLMDPQQRLFLETVWRTIEDAGYKPSAFSGSKMGIFVGVATNDYSDLIKAKYDVMEAHVSTGMSHSILVNRISFLLNLHGPSEPVDTACSSSLVAIHRAMESIRNGDCDTAIAGGVNVITSPALFSAFGKAGMLSPDGRCKTFDKSANGYVRGEGVGAVLLKSLSRAQADGDHIYALIKGTAVNHGGHANSLTAPNSAAQADLLVSAYTKAGVNPATVSYIETHGTGTSLGDPVEIEGLKKAFQTLNEKYGNHNVAESSCALGAVKTNIGHLETAAGIASVLKVLLAFKNRKIPGNVHLNEINPYIKLGKTPFYIAKETKEWENLRNSDGTIIPRRAGVSSFGFGGVNAHIVLEEYLPEVEITPAREEESLILLSAKTNKALEEYAKSLLDFLKNNPRVNLANLAYTLQVGREEMDIRLAIIGISPEDLTAKLEQFCAGEEVSDLFCGSRPESVEEYRSILNNPEGNVFIQSLLDKGKYRELGKLWVTGGLKIDWPRLYCSRKFQRLSVPTYPFARNRYWVTDDEDACHAAIQEPPRRFKQIVAEIPAGHADPDYETNNTDLPWLYIKNKDRLTQFLKNQIAGLLKINESDINAAQPLTELGLDSILMLELRNNINTRLKTDFFLEQFMESIDLKKIADILQYQLALDSVIIKATQQSPEDKEVILI